MGDVIQAAHRFTKQRAALPQKGDEYYLAPNPMTDYMAEMLKAFEVKTGEGNDNPSVR